MPRGAPYVCALVALVVLPAVVHAAAVRDHLYGVKALSASEAWAVGNFGAIYHTTNGGTSWDQKDSTTKLPLFSIDFADARQGWAVGKSAMIVHTADGGATWKAQKSPLPADKHLFKVDAVDAKTVWAVGDWGTVVVTHDGGEHWDDRSLGTFTVQVEQTAGRNAATVTDDIILYDIAFPDAQHGYIVGEFGTVLATSDGGSTWWRRDTGTDKTLFGINFTDADHGWAVGIDGLILRTSDAGRTWTIQRGEAQVEALDDVGFLAMIKNPGLYAVKVEGKRGIVVGDVGVLLTSTDGGETWDRLELPEKDRLVWMRDVSLVPGSGGFAVGANGFSAVVDQTDIRLPDGEKAHATGTH